MKPVEPTAIVEGMERVTFAKDQPEYIPLPAARGEDGIVLTEWELTPEEREAVANGANIRLFVSTINSYVLPDCGDRMYRLQPVMLEVVK
jgi:hypothetical protein